MKPYDEGHLFSNSELLDYRSSNNNRMVRLYIIRHADPDYDIDRANGGSLTDHGKLEAKALGKYLKSQGLTHAYSSPMGRARLTAELALKHHLPDLWDNIGVEEWTKELTSWRQTSSIAGNVVASKDDTKVGEGDGMTLNSSQSKVLKKPRAIWDLPASVARTQLSSCIEGSNSRREYRCPTGWRHTCLDHAYHSEAFDKLCRDSDEFLAKHGIFCHGQRYCVYNNEKNDTSTSSLEMRNARIAVFCHASNIKAGFGLTWLAYLLGIPLPLFYSSFYLSPSSVSVVLFDEHNNYPDIHYLAPHDDVLITNEEKDQSSKSKQPAPRSCTWMTPRALCIGGTNHLSMNDLKTSNSKYENWDRPSGIKANFW